MRARSLRRVLFLMLVTCSCAALDAASGGSELERSVFTAAFARREEREGK
jgi:hypothetical protein